LALTTAFLAGLGGQAVQAQQPGFTQKFVDLDQCRFRSTGNTTYFPLVPGYQWVLVDRTDKTRLVITVLNQTKQIRFAGRAIDARVVEEKETTDGVLTEIALNYFAICEDTNSVYYFGEAVDFYENGQVVSHEGSWEAGKGGALPGLQMLGTVVQGARYYQEVAPGVALDKAEILSTDGTVRTRAGRFRDVVSIRETNDLDPTSISIKQYAPGCGFIKDAGLELQSYSGGSQSLCGRSRDSD